MSSIATPISFSPNTLIKSADVNTNFTAINTVVNGNLDNTNIVAGAAIAVNKLAALTASKVVLTDGSGFLTTGTPSIAQGGTGQITAGAAFNALSPITTTGDMIYSASGATNSRLAVGSANQVLKSVNGVPAWATFSNNGINYIASNPDAEVDTAGWSTYADAAQNTPVNGTGGSASSTWTRTTSTPLRGSGSFLWTRTAANRQGEGVSFDFTIDQADQSQPLAISFDYKVASGTFLAADGITAPLNDGTTTQNAGMSDLEVFVYDVTNSVLIPVTPQVLTSTSTTSANFKARFQAASNSTSYRLCLHTARSTAVAFTMQFDNFFVGPQAVNYGYAGGDWNTNYTFAPSAGFGAVTNSTWQSRRVGDSLEVMGIWKNGTVAGSVASIALPAGLAIDTSSSKMISGAKNLVGWFTRLTSTTAGYFRLYVDTASSSTIYVTYSTSVDAYSTTNGSTITNSLDSSSVRFTIPIAGWSSNLIVSNDAETRVVAASYYVNTATLFNTTQINFDVKDIDTHSAVTTGAGAWKFTAPVSGVYKVSASAVYNAGSAVGCILRKNGTSYIHLFQVQTSGTAYYNGTTSINLVAGDYIDLSTDGSVTLYGLLSSTRTTAISIERVSGPSAIASTEKVFLQYTGNAGTALTANTTNIDFATKVVDSHSAWNGTTFTAPRASWYNVQGGAKFTTNIDAELALYVDTVKKVNISQFGGSTAHAKYTLSGGIFLNAGQALTIRSDTSATLGNDANQHWISISSQG